MAMIPWRACRKEVSGMEGSPCSGHVRLGVVILFRIGLIASFPICGVLAGCEQDHYSPPASYRHEPTDEERLRSAIDDAPYAAEQVLAGVLKAPTQAKYSDRKLMRQEGNFALASVTVDAPNSFGVRLRSRWCYILKYEPPRGARFTWNKIFGVWDCSGGIDETALLTRMAGSGWPGSGEKLEATRPKKKNKK